MMVKKIRCNFAPSKYFNRLLDHESTWRILLVLVRAFGHIFCKGVLLR